MIPIDEKHIIKKLKAGDNEAYKYIYDYHYVALCKLSYYLLKDRVQAESIVNDVIFHLWEVRDKLELVPPLRSYLIVAVRNKCLNYLALKQQETEIRFSAMERAGIQLQNIVSDNVHPLGNLLKEELESKIHESINKLPPVCKQVFTMSRFREMSYKEISCELGISVNTVKYHINSALVTGLTGFDSVAKWYVSMQCVVDWHYNPSFQNFIWQRKLCSCCLIES